jgi:hypothetical protein
MLPVQLLPSEAVIHSIGEAHVTTHRIIVWRGAAGLDGFLLRDLSSYSVRKQYRVVWLFLAVVSMATACVLAALRKSNQVEVPLTLLAPAFLVPLAFLIAHQLHRRTLLELWIGGRSVAAEIGTVTQSDLTHLFAAIESARSHTHPAPPAATSMHSLASSIGPVDPFAAQQMPIPHLGPRH